MVMEQEKGKFIVGGVNWKEDHIHKFTRDAPLHTMRHFRDALKLAECKLST